MTFFVGADSSPITSGVNVQNTGIRAVINVLPSQPSTPSGAILAFWVSQAFVNGNNGHRMWAQVGYFFIGNSHPEAFAQYWDLTANVTVQTFYASVTPGNHEFKLYLKSGTVWEAALDGVDFGGFDIGTSTIDTSYHLQFYSEEGYVTTPFPILEVSVPLCMEYFAGGKWNQWTRTASYSNGSWGEEGHIQNSSLPDDSMNIGGSISQLANGTPLWIGSSSVSLVAHASASPTSGVAPLPVSFSASGSGGFTPYSYLWSFGDGQTTVSQNPIHTYLSPGTYVAILTVTDAFGAKALATVTITVTSKPPPPPPPLHSNTVPLIVGLTLAGVLTSIIIYSLGEG